MVNNLTGKLKDQKCMKMKFITYRLGLSDIAGITNN
jgi:hypothetical protein